MKNHLVCLFALEWESVLGQAKSVAVDIWWIFAVVAAVQSADQLCEDGPNKLLVGVFIASLQILNHHSQVSIAAVLHVEVQVMRGLQVLLLVVGDNIRMAETP